jgi:hypothetical protein
MRVCDLILGLCNNWVRLADHLTEDVGQPQVMQLDHQEADIEQMALWSSATLVWDLVLKGSDGTSSLVASLSSAADLINGRIDAMTTNGVCLEGARLALTAILSHFPELETELDLLGSGRNVDLIESKLDALWTQTCQASESLA